MCCNQSGIYYFAGRKPYTTGFRRWVKVVKSSGMCYTCVMGTWKSKNRHKYLLQYHIILYANTGGKYYVSVLVETEHEELPQTGRNIGLDLGIKDLCITSDGKRHENPKIIRKHEKKLAKLQRQLSHKEKGSNNYYKTEKKDSIVP